MKAFFMSLGFAGFLLLFGAVAVAESASIALTLLLVLSGVLMMFLSVCGVQVCHAMQRQKRMQRIRRERERIVFRTRISYRPVQL